MTEPCQTNQSPQTDGLCNRVQRINITDDPRSKLRSWLGQTLKIVITDGRIIVGTFVCTDRDGNVILENSREYSNTMEDNNEPRLLCLALVPGRHAKSISLMKH